MSLELSPLAPGEELIDAKSFQRLHTGIPGSKPGWHSAPLVGQTTPRSGSWPPQPQGAANPPAAAPEIELVHRLTRQDVERTAVQRARMHADAVAFFLVRRHHIQATCCDPEPLRDLRPIHWSERRFTLSAVLERQTPYCGAPWRDALTSLIVRSLGREGVRQIALIPISVYERPVAFLYADAGRKPFAAQAIAELSSIGREIAGIFERMLVERKRDQGRDQARPEVSRS